MEVKSEQNLVGQEPPVKTEEELKVKSNLKSGEDSDRANIVVLMMPDQNKMDLSGYAQNK